MMDDRSPLSIDPRVVAIPGRITSSVSPNRQTLVAPRRTFVGDVYRINLFAT